MAPDSGLQARVAQLEEELATQRAQVRGPAQDGQLQALGASRAPRRRPRPVRHTHRPPWSTLAGRGGSYQRRAVRTGVGPPVGAAAAPLTPRHEQGHILAADRDARPALSSSAAAAAAAVHTQPPLPLPQANEQRYRLLEGKHTALVAEKEKLFQENEALRQVRLQTGCCRPARATAPVPSCCLR